MSLFGEALAKGMKGQVGRVTSDGARKAATTAVHEGEERALKDAAKAGGREVLHQGEHAALTGAKTNLPPLPAGEQIKETLRNSRERALLEEMGLTAKEMKSIANKNRNPYFAEGAHGDAVRDARARIPQKGDYIPHKSLEQGNPVSHSQWRGGKR